MMSDQALELKKSAQPLLASGDLTEGASLLLEAAKLHRSEGSTYDEARCLQMAATALRSAGSVAESRELAAQAAALSVEDPRLEVSILAEQAEGAIAQGEFESALPLLSNALALAQEADLSSEAMNALLRRRARVYVELGDLNGFTLDYDNAYDLLSPDKAGFVRTEQAGILLEQGLEDEAEAVLSSIPESSDPHLRAEKLLVGAKIARINERFREAAAKADEARRLALEAVAPLSYFTASVELAESQGALGQFEEAYGALARAWATMGDLLGKDIAKSWVEPVLLAFKFAWGDQTFAAAKQAYEAGRRTAMEIS